MCLQNSVATPYTDSGQHVTAATILDSTGSDRASVLEGLRVARCCLEEVSLLRQPQLTLACELGRRLLPRSD